MATKKERLSKAAGSALDRLVSGADLKQGEKEKAPQKAPKTPKRVFSFRAPENEVDEWRTYAEATGQTVDAMAAVALREYVKAHPLTPEQNIIFAYKMTMKMKQKGE